jgi:predicted kinase
MILSAAVDASRVRSDRVQRELSGVNKGRERVEHKTGRVYRGAGSKRERRVKSVPWRACLAEGRRCVCVCVCVCVCDGT